MYDYLTNGATAAQRRANVAHYINVDGQTQNAGVPTLAVWAGRGTPGRSMQGAQNVTIPDQTHVQTCTSAESFVQYYLFLTGRLPSHDIVPQTRLIRIAGKALNFPQNAGLLGATVQIWPVDVSGLSSVDMTLVLEVLTLTAGSEALVVYRGSHRLPLRHLSLGFLVTAASLRPARVRTPCQTARLSRRDHAAKTGRGFANQR